MTDEWKKEAKPRELSANEDLINETHVSEPRLHNEEKDKSIILYIKNTFNILPIVRSVLSGNTSREYIGVHKRTFFFSCDTYKYYGIYLYVGKCTYPGE